MMIVDLFVKLKNLSKILVNFKLIRTETLHLYLTKIKNHIYQQINKMYNVDLTIIMKKN